MVTTLDDEVVLTKRQHALAMKLPRVANRSVDGGHCACLQPGSGFVDALVDVCQTVAAARLATGLRYAG